MDHCNETLTDDRVVTPNFDFDFDLTTLDYDSLGNLSIEGYETEPILNAFCVPRLDSIASAIAVSLEDDYDEFVSEWGATLDSVGESLSLALDDLYVVRYVFIGAAFSALLVSLTWGWFIRHCGGVIVWCSVAFTLFGVIAIAYYMVEFAETAYNFGWDTIGDVMYYSGIALAVLDGMFFLAICFMWHRIRLAIALGIVSFCLFVCVLFVLFCFRFGMKLRCFVFCFYFMIAKETTRALNSMWGMFFYPVVPFLFFSMFVAYWLAGMFFACF